MAFPFVPACGGRKGPRPPRRARGGPLVLTHRGAPLLRGGEVPGGHPPRAEAPGRSALRMGERPLAARPDAYGGARRVRRVAPDRGGARSAGEERPAPG